MLVVRVKRIQKIFNSNRVKYCIINENVVLFQYRTSHVKLSLIRDIAQLGRAPALGAGGRRFKSYYPDSNLNYLNSIDRIEIILYY